MVSNRSVTLSLSGVTITRQLARGAPQGGILSPLLWNLTINGLLSDPNIDQDFLQAFSDDLALLIGGFDIPTMRAKCQRYLTLINRWCSTIGVRLSALKSQAILFTKKRTCRLDKPLQVEGAVIPMVSEVRYLGLILDSKLSWKQHAEYASSKAMKALHSVSSACRITWGLPPAYMRWLFLHISMPTLLFGSVVWHHKVVSSPSLLNLFNRVHRTGILMITGAFRSSSNSIIEIIAGVRPMEQMIERSAILTAIRLKFTLKWIPAAPGTGKTCHARNIDVFLGSHLPSLSTWDMIPKQLVLEFPFTTEFLVKDEALESYMLIHVANDVVAYTDGSVKGGLAGAGATYSLNDEEVGLTWHLGQDVSIFQAELYAIEQISVTLLDTLPSPASIAICSDSQAAIKALLSTVLSTSSVLAARSALINLCTIHKVSVFWTPAHIGIPGNEKADSLANIGSDGPPAEGPRPVPFAECFIRGFLDKVLFENHVKFLRSSCDSASLSIRLSLNLLLSNRYKFCFSNKHQVRTISHLFSGHSYLRYFQHKIGHEAVPSCRLCEEAPETTEHFLSQCPASILQRKATMGHFTFRGNYTLSHQQGDSLQKWPKQLISSTIFDFDKIYIIRKISFC